MEIIKSDHSIENQGKKAKYTQSKKIFHTDKVFFYHEKVEPGKKSSAPHFHTNIDEIIYLLRGQLYAYEGSEYVLLNSGDSILFKANSMKKHYLENKSNEDAEFLLFRNSTDQDQVIY